MASQVGLRAAILRGELVSLPTPRDLRQFGTGSTNWSLYEGPYSGAEDSPNGEPRMMYVSLGTTPLTFQLGAQWSQIGPDVGIWYRGTRPTLTTRRSFSLLIDGEEFEVPTPEFSDHSAVLPANVATGAQLFVVRDLEPRWHTVGILPTRDAAAAYRLRIYCPIGSADYHPGVKPQRLLTSTEPVSLVNGVLTPPNLSPASLSLPSMASGVDRDLLYVREIWLDNQTGTDVVVDFYRGPTQRVRRFTVPTQDTKVLEFPMNTLVTADYAFKVITGGPLLATTWGGR